LVASPEPITSYLRTHVFPYIAGAAFSLDAVRKFLFPRISQIAIKYRSSPLIDHVGDTEDRAGDRMPYFIVDGVSIYDTLREPKFHLLTFSDGKEKTGTDELSSGFAGMADRHLLPLYPAVAEIFGTSETFSVLLRPDNYVATISPGKSLAPIEKYLKGCL
jgi:hypothetical protein